MDQEINRHAGTGRFVSDAEAAANPAGTVTETIRDNPYDVDGMIAYLNELNSLDTAAMQALLSQRVQCGDALADHPTVQVGTQMNSAPVEERWQVGVLGILNGFYGVIGDGERKHYGHIAAMYDEGKLIGFKRLRNELRND